MHVPSRGGISEKGSTKAEADAGVVGKRAEFEDDAAVVFFPFFPPAPPRSGLNEVAAAAASSEISRVSRSVYAARHISKEKKNVLWSGGISKYTSAGVDERVGFETGARTAGLLAVSSSEKSKSGSLAQYKYDKKKVRRTLERGHISIRVVRRSRWCWVRGRYTHSRSADRFSSFSRHI